MITKRAADAKKSSVPRRSQSVSRDTVNSEDAPSIVIDYSVLEYLGVGLYSSTPAVVSEIVANAWDADAENVWISVDIDKNVITIEDDGHGMTKKEFQEKFLHVGYHRRSQPGGAKSEKKKRPAMGRKGIGKLAMFSLAEQIDVLSRRQGKEFSGGTIDVPALKQYIIPGASAKEPFTLGPISQRKAMRKGHGTKIVLRKIDKSVAKTVPLLRSRVARRFTVIGDKTKFNVEIDGIPISRVDRGFYPSVQCLWTFGTVQQAAEIQRLCTNLAQGKTGKKFHTKLNGVVSTKPRLTINGYIASVTKPSALKDATSNINHVSVFANGRMFEEDLLKEIGNSKVFNNYLVGEIHADFLDTDDVDRATSSREAIKRNDPLFAKLLEKLRSLMSVVEDEWDRNRRDLGYANSPDSNQAVREWIDSLPDHKERLLADRLMVSILNQPLANSTVLDASLRRDLYESTILGFEKLRARRQLERLETISDVSSPAFRNVFTTIDDVEATLFHSVVTNRLAVINRFDEIISTRQLEKVAQLFLVDHLWLLDPTWDRVPNSEQIEVVLTKYLRTQKVPGPGARLDIAYRTSGGQHVIIELKRPGKHNLVVGGLNLQMNKYVTGLGNYLAAHPDFLGNRADLPRINGIFVVESLQEASVQEAAQMNATGYKCYTYAGLLKNAKAAYQAYIAKTPETSRVDGIVRKIASGPSRKAPARKKVTGRGV